MLPDQDMRPFSRVFPPLMMKASKNAGLGPASMQVLIHTINMHGPSKHKI